MCVTHASDRTAGDSRFVLRARSPWVDGDEKYVRQPETTNSGEEIVDNQKAGERPIHAGYLTDK